MYVRASRHFTRWETLKTSSGRRKERGESNKNDYRLIVGTSAMFVSFFFSALLCVDARKHPWPMQY